MTRPIDSVLALGDLIVNFIVLAAYYVGVIFGSVASIAPSIVADDFNFDTIAVKDASLNVWIAKSDTEQRNGLSFFEMHQLESRNIDGMLFVYEDSSVANFWMRGMQFDLDFVWIKSGEVVKIDENILSPANNNGDTMTISSDPYEVGAVLELPAGQVDTLDIKVGDSVEF
ncbi:DUF192 domain-containing protein [Candidatus Uhrbacteria bacterium]|jgi:uncharacterized membrane protein (UPF0127 family)|nr:DUF192 domain-containing protein [Candidatus Uhrbacteria bacterium]